MPVSGLHREEVSIPANVLAGTSKVRLLNSLAPNFAFSYVHIE